MRILLTWYNLWNPSAAQGGVQEREGLLSANRITYCKVLDTTRPSFCIKDRKVGTWKRKLLSGGAAPIANGLTHP
uniref:Uncharacterized protein n=1 Tax=Engystomops pustulosus TaxID=76066 RepID=A0AAV6YYQ8_ENGPU|nr:hypothetical protein GDO81_019649 [Engystomops pustulosus]KAG8540257.1 hypothetical protein GDO81_019648 [Engystomops pustulosus]